MDVLGPLISLPQSVRVQGLRQCHTAGSQWPVANTDFFPPVAAFGGPPIVTLVAPLISQLPALMSPPSRPSIHPQFRCLNPSRDLSVRPYLCGLGTVLICPPIKMGYSSPHSFLDSLCDRQPRLQAEVMWHRGDVTSLGSDLSGFEPQPCCLRL